MLANLLAALKYCQHCNSAPVWLSAASQRMASNRRGLRSAADVTSTVADALSTSLSRPCRRNCKILSNALLRCTEKSTHVKRWTQSTTNFWLLRTSWEGRSEGCQVDTVPTKSNCYGYYRCRRSLLSSSNRQPSDRVPLVPTSPLYYALPSTRIRPVADLTAPRTSRHRRPDADSQAQSTRRRLHSVADLTAPTTCRRLRHFSDATVSWRHIATRRSVRYHVDTCLPSTTTILCRHRELATPFGYAAHF